MAINVSTNIQAIFVDSRIRPGTVFLPSTFTIPGRVLTFKDQFGAFSTNSMTLTTNNANQVIDSLVTSTINRSALGWQSFIAGNNNRWYTVGGTLINTINASTVNTTVLSSVNISSGNLFVSSSGFIDQTLGSTQQLYVQSTFLFYSFSNQSTIISGTRQSFGGLFLPIRRPFLPNQVTGLSVWLDAADTNTTITTIPGGNSLTQWRDKSANSLRMSQATLANMPTIARGFLNGNNVVGFTTTQSMTSLTNFTLGQSQTFFVVFNPVTTTNFFFIEQGTNAPTGPGSYLYGSNNNLFSMRDTSGIFRNSFDSQAGLAVAPFATVNTWYFCSYVNSNVALQAVNDLYWSINGSRRTMEFNVWNNITSGNTTAGLNVNVRNSASNYYGEILIYNAALTLAQVRQVEGYLAWKWGLAGNLPASHPFKNSPP